MITRVNFSPPNYHNIQRSRTEEKFFEPPIELEIEENSYGDSVGLEYLLNPDNKND